MLGFRAVHTSLQPERPHLFCVCGLVLLQFLRGKHIIGTEPYLVFLCLVLPLAILSFRLGFPSFSLHDGYYRSMDMWCFLVCVKCSCHYIFLTKGGVKPLHRAVAPLSQTPLAFKPEHILVRAGKDKPQSLNLVVCHLSINVCRGNAVFYGFRAVGDICGELHQLTVEVRAGGIDVVRHECTLNVGGHCRIVAPSLVYV